MKRSKAITIASIITSLMGAPLQDLIDDETDEKLQKHGTFKKVSVRRVRAPAELPDDPALPGLVAMRRLCAAEALSVQSVEDGPVDLHMRGYTPGSRATLEARSERRRFAVKAYADDPAPEAALYEALAAAGLAGSSGARVPPLLACERELRLLVIGWLEGPTLEELIEQGQGQRAGELAARWMQRAASLPVKLGPPLGAASVLKKSGRCVAALVAADPQLGATATALAETLKSRQPTEGAHHLVHGTLYSRHILDLGDGPGVIDWQKFGQGPLELDAGTFLTTTWRIGLRPGTPAGAADRAVEVFLAQTDGLLNPGAVSWHRAAMLLRLANKLTRKQHEDDWSKRAHTLLAEAARLAKVVA